MLDGAPEPLDEDIVKDVGGDSLHVGLDGSAPSSAADLTGFTDEWGWSKVTMSGGSASVDLTTTGEHTLDAWMREDGLRVDRVLLVTDTNYIPTGLGPAESPFDTITKTIPGGLGTTSISYGYDPLYRLTDASYSGAITASFAYDYDPVGNMTAFTETVDAQTTSVTRSFDGANRLEYAVNASGTTTYTYDANGNLVELLPPGATVANPVGGLRYEYDQRNLLVSHETNPDGTAWVLQAEYVYDGANDRLHQVDYTGGTPITTTYTNDVFGLTQVLVADDGTSQVYNLFGLDLISQDSGAEVRTLLVDGLGSVRLEMVGSLVETATTYSPYGEVLEQTGTSGTVYGFTGEQEDGATGLLFLRAHIDNTEICGQRNTQGRLQGVSGPRTRMQTIRHKHMFKGETNSRRSGSLPARVFCGRFLGMTVPRSTLSILTRSGHVWSILRCLVHLTVGTTLRKI